MAEGGTVETPLKKWGTGSSRGKDIIGGGRGDEYFRAEGKKKIFQREVPVHQIEKEKKKKKKTPWMEWKKGNFH